MKLRTRNSLIAVLLCLMLALSAFAGVLFVKSQSALAEEEHGIVPLTGEEMMNSKAAKVFPPNGGALYWDEIHTQMRIMFKFAGVEKPTRQINADILDKVSDYVLLTVNGETKPLKGWPQLVSTDSWCRFMEGAVNSGSDPADPDTFELWISSQNTNFMNAISHVTIKQGFRWYVGGEAFSDATVEKDYILENGGNERGWLAAQSVPQAPELASGLYPVYGDELKTSAAASKIRSDGQSGGGIWWNNSDHTQMRLYFKMVGIEPLPQRQLLGGQYVSPNANYLEITTNDGTTQTWAQRAPGWLAPMEAAVQNSEANIYELWMCGPAAFMESITSVTIKPGFQWYVGGDSQPVSGTQIDKEYKLKLEGEWWILDEADPDPDPDYDTALVPLADGAHMQSGAPAPAKGTIWDPTQMRIYFSFEGVARPDPNANLTGQVINGDLVYITDSEGHRNSVTELKAAGRIA